MIRSHLKLALKVLARRKVFTAISLFGIALTLLVLTVAAALLDHTFGPHPPESRQGRTLYCIYVQMTGKNVTSGGPAGYRLLDGHTRGLQGVERMGIASLPSEVASYAGGERLDLSLRYADADSWRVLDYEFLEGAPFGEEDVAGARRVAVITESTRRRALGEGPAVGRTLVAGGVGWTVVGVVADVSRLRIVSFGEVWVPLTTQPGDTWRSQLDGSLVGLYLLSPGASPDAVQAEFAARMSRVDLAGTEFDTVTAVPDTVFGSVARMMLGGRADASSRTHQLAAALGAVALLFALLPLVNLVNLAVSRIFERAAEIGVRKAFGAPRRSLVLQFVLENVVLTVIGGLLAVAASALVLRAINASGVIEYASLAVNWRVFGWGLGLSLLFGVLSGAWPAWRMARLHPVDALKGGTR